MDAQTFFAFSSISINTLQPNVKNLCSKNVPFLKQVFYWLIVGLIPIVSNG